MYAGIYTIARPSPHSIYSSKLDSIHIHNFRLHCKKEFFFIGISMVNWRKMFSCEHTDLECGMCSFFLVIWLYLFNVEWEKLFIHTKLIKHCKIAFYVILHEAEYYLILFISTHCTKLRKVVKNCKPSSFITFKSISLANNSIPLKASHSLLLFAHLCRNGELELAFLLEWIWESPFFICHPLL